MFAAVSRNQHKHRRGFTLIELLVVMSVIAILAALLVPVLALVREQMHISAVSSTIQGVSMAMTTYKSMYKRFPPDKHVNYTLTSSQCLVSYLSGPTIFYDEVASPIDYPWTHELYTDAPGKGGEGRKNLHRHYDFKSKYLKDFGDHAPALIDPVGKRFSYNATGEGGYYERYGDAKHGGKEYDLFSAGPDGLYGTEDDIANWQDRLGWGYDSFGLNDGTH